MLKETFDKAKELSKSIELMEFMSNRLSMSGGLNDVFNSGLVTNYGKEIGQLKDDFTKIINEKLEILKQQFETL